MIKKCNARKNLGSKASSISEMRTVADGMRFVNSRIALFFILLLVAATACNISMSTVDAFCWNPAGTPTPQRSVFGRSSTRSQTASSSALGLFRPDWMRRAGRIEEKRKERRSMYESLRKRQDELGLSGKTFSKMDKRDDKAPQQYRVVSWNNDSNNSTSGVHYDDGLAVYPFVPEDDVEANDESNVLDWLDQGEIVTSVSTKKVADNSVPPLRMAVVAATAIYNVQQKIRTDILWIEHDKGGWSPSIVDGVTRLIPIEDADNGSQRQ